MIARGSIIKTQTILPLPLRPIFYGRIRDISQLMIIRRLSGRDDEALSIHHCTGSSSKPLDLEAWLAWLDPIVGIALFATEASNRPNIKVGEDYFLIG